MLMFFPVPVQREDKNGIPNVLLLRMLLQQTIIPTIKSNYLVFIFILYISLYKETIKIIFIDKETLCNPAL